MKITPLRYIAVALFSTIWACKPRINHSEVSAVQAANFIEKCTKPADAFDYNNLFCLTRNLLVRDDIRKMNRKIFASALVIPPAEAARLKAYGFDDVSLKDISETQYLAFLQDNPQLYTPTTEFLKQAVSPTANLKDIEDKLEKALTGKTKLVDFMKSMNDPLEPLDLFLPGDDPKAATHLPAYDNLKLFVTHDYVDHTGNLVKPQAGGAKKAWIDFIKMAKKELVLNVFDFDLQDVAKALIERAGAGVKVRVGIDKGVIAARPEVAAVAKMLELGGVRVFAVDSVGLNHQKMTSIDWSQRGQGKVLISSGNLTQSCLGEEGDLVGEPSDVRKKFESVPNANHLLTMDSDILAALIASELTKTMDMGLRGKGANRAGMTGTYPLSGAFRIWGPNKGAQHSYIIIAFTPGGGLKSMNAIFLARMIDRVDLKEGPIRMAQFAFASKEVTTALRLKAESEIKAGGAFDYLAVGDKSFAMREFSQFLVLSDLEAHKNTSGVTSYKALDNGEWFQAFGKDKTAFASFRNNVRIGPRKYRDHQENINGKSVKINAKIHHKLFVGGDLATLGTSFNFSSGAEVNNEQMVAIVDIDLANDARGIIEALAKDGSTDNLSIIKEAKRRNAVKSKEADDDDAEDGGRSIQAGR